MSSTVSGSYRREVACSAIGSYEAWIRAKDDKPLDAAIVGQLVMCARWLLEQLAGQS